MSSSSGDVIPPSPKRKRESSALLESTKRRKTELVKRIAQQEQYFFEAWRDKYEQNLECARDDIWAFRHSKEQASRKLDSPFAALDIPQMKQASTALAAASDRFYKAKNKEVKETAKLANFKLVEQIHIRMVFQEHKEAVVRRLQKRLDRAKERFREAEVAKDSWVNLLDRLNIGQLDSLIEEFEY